MMKSWLGSSCFVFVCLLVAGPHVRGSESTEVACPRCAQKACHLTVSTKTEETECFEVECKDICIPPVTFPWQCGPKNCGRVRTVHVLVTEKSEQQVCEYKWNVVAICPSCRAALQATQSDQVVSERVVCDAAPNSRRPQAPRQLPVGMNRCFHFPCYVDRQSQATDSPQMLRNRSVSDQPE